MALNSPENFRKPISGQLSEYLREHSSKADRAEVSIKTGVGSSTIRDVVYQNRSLTKNNVKAIIALMKIAIQNCMRSREEAKEAKEYLTKELPLAT